MKIDKDKKKKKKKESEHGSAIIKDGGIDIRMELGLLDNGWN